MSGHHCHYPPCARVIPRKLFMCRDHWYKIPAPMRRAIWEAYNPGQEEGDAPVTKQYQFVTDEAIKWLMEQESKQGDLFK